jgi:hypothetical protein
VCDDLICSARFQYLSWVFAEDKAAASAVLPAATGASSPSSSVASSAITDVYIVPRADFVDTSKSKGSPSANKNKPTVYGTVLRDGMISQAMSTMGMSNWKDRYAVLQDDVFMIFDTKAAFQSKSTAASVCVPIGAVKSRSMDDTSSSGGTGAPAGVTSPTNKPKDAKPNTIELTGGPLKMDIIRFACDSKDNMEKWLDAFNNAHLRLVKVCRML